MPIKMRHHYTARHIAIYRYTWLLLSRRGTITRCGYVPCKPPAMQPSRVAVVLPNKDAPSQRPLQCVTTASQQEHKPTHYRCNLVVQSHIEPFLLSPDTSKADTTHPQPLIEALCKPANKPLCEPVHLPNQVTLPSPVNPVQSRIAASQTI